MKRNRLVILTLLCLFGICYMYATPTAPATVSLTEELDSIESSVRSLEVATQIEDETIKEVDRATLADKARSAHSLMRARHSLDSIKSAALALQTQAGSFSLLSKNQAVSLVGGMNHYQNFVEQHAVDGNPATKFWSFPEPRIGNAYVVDLLSDSGLYGEELKKHMPVVRRVEYIESSSDRCEHCQIEWSADNIRWQKIDELPVLKTVGNQATSSVDVPAARARYVRLYVHHDNTKTWWQLFAFNVYGSKS